ncbi:unnamed protein product [Ixodes pacificus]
MTRGVGGRSRKMQTPSISQVYYTSDEPVQALPAIVKTAALYFSASRGVTGVQCYARQMITATNLWEASTLNSHVGTRSFFGQSCLEKYRLCSVLCAENSCVFRPQRPLSVCGIRQKSPGETHYSYTLSKTP